MDAEDISELGRKLDIVMRLLAFQLEDGMTGAEAAPLLNRLGMGNSDIADVIGSTTKTVRARISESKKS